MPRCDGSTWGGDMSDEAKVAELRALMPSTQASIYLNAGSKIGRAHV